MLDMDLNRTEFFHNPYPFYEKIRLSGKPLWLEHKQPNLKNKGVWLFTGYADALTIFKSDRFSKSVLSQRQKGAATSFDLHLLHRDPPDHERLRRLVAPYFSVVTITKLEAQIEQLAHQLIDAIEKRSEADLIKDFAETLPLNIIAKMMGLPESDMMKIRQWSIEIGNGFDSIIGTDEVYMRQRHALAELLNYVHEAIDFKKKQPANDLITQLNQACQQALISEEELIAMVGFLLFSGHETTINLIGNGLLLMLQHPDQWETLKSEPSLIHAAIEEILRFESPEQRTSFRMAKEAMVIAGHEIMPGEQVGVIIGAANRDSLAFETPHRFDIRRTPNKHLAFGSGAHQCLGMHMARLEAKVAIAVMAQRLPDIRLQQQQPCWRRNSFFRGLETLPVYIR